MAENTISLIVQWIWVPIVTGMVWLWGRVFGVDARTRLLEQQAEHLRLLRKEDQARRDKERDAILDKIDQHHTLVIQKLDDVERRVKNGH